MNTPPPRWFMRVQWRLHKLLWRLSGRRLGNRVMGMTVIELTTTGRRSGEPRTVLLTALPDGDGWLVAGTNAGADRDPAWVHNLRADARAEVATGSRSLPVRATFLEGDDHAAAWERFTAAADDYATYAALLKRTVPIVRLTPDAGR